MSRRPPLPFLLILLLLMSACTDDGATVREVGTEDGGSASGSQSGSASGSGSSTAVADAECAPVGTDLEAEAQETVAISAVDFAYEPDEIAVDAGVVTFEMSNDGAAVHELAFLPGGGEVPFTEDGEPDEAALEAAGAFELEGFGSGQTCNATYDLEPGDYTIFCIIQTDEGVTHYEEGMDATLTVS